MDTRRSIRRAGSAGDEADAGPARHLAAGLRHDGGAAFVAADRECDIAIVKRIDTHAASVFLAGPRAFKVKRAVRFPFLDYSTLAKRKAACEAELKINQPLA